MHFDFVSPVGHASSGLVDEVGAQVRLLAADDRAADEPAGGDVGTLDQRAVALHAERIHREHEHLFRVVKCAQQDLDVVVAEDLVPVGKGHGRTAVRLVRADAEVDRVGRVPDQHLGGIGGGHAVVRGVLRETGQDGGMRPDRVRQIAIDENVRLDPRNPDLQLTIPARVNDGIGGE